MNLYMENLEQNSTATGLDYCKPRNWKRYVEDVICIVHTGKAKELQQHVNNVDPTYSIRFTQEDRYSNM